MADRKDRNGTVNKSDILIFILIVAVVAAAVISVKHIINNSDKGEDVTVTVRVKLSDLQTEALTVGLPVTVPGYNGFSASVCGMETGNDGVYIRLFAKAVNNGGYECGGVRLAVGESYDMRVGELRISGICCGMEKGLDSDG